MLSVVLGAFSATAALPRLAVVIAVDQLRADYLDRFEPWMCEGGFRRMLQGGTFFSDAHHRHSLTVTAPGHAVILTGVFAETHGIIGNSWPDRETWDSVNAVEDQDSPLLGVEPTPADPFGGRKTGRSPRNLKASTVGDQLKLRYGDKSRVIGVAGKDRSAILLGGRLADGAFWLYRNRVLTSTYYGPVLPEWVAAFNERHLVEQYFGTTWDRLLDAEIYDRVQGPDDWPGESEEYGLGRTFPRVINGGRSSISSHFYSAFSRTPFASEVLLEMAKEIIVHERMGHHEGPDLLGISFSQIDTVGHAYGVDSHELMDSVLRLDRILAQLLSFLDEQVGPGNWVAVLTADHGASPLPERLGPDAAKLPARRYSGEELNENINAALNNAFGPLPDGARWFTLNSPYLYLNRELLAERGVSVEAAARVACDTLKTLSFVQTAFTSEDIAKMPRDGDTLEAMVRRSHNVDLSGDVVFVVKPYFMRREIGTGHGTPYRYDTNVPVLWYGAGIPAGRRNERIGVDDIAPTLSSILRVPAPPQAQGRQLFPAQ